MKTLIALALAIAFSLAANAAEPLKWIVMTVETVWPDGRGSEVGEIEVVLKEDSKDYFVWAENGQQYRVPKANAKVLSTEDAALMLIQKRQSLYSELGEAYDAVDALTPATQKAETPRERSRRKKAERDAKAKAAVDSFYDWKLKQFLNKQ